MKAVFQHPSLHAPPRNKSMRRRLYALLRTEIIILHGAASTLSTTSRCRHSTCRDCRHRDTDFLYNRNPQEASDSQAHITIGTDDLAGLGWKCLCGKVIPSRRVQLYTPRPTIFTHSPPPFNSHYAAHQTCHRTSHIISEYKAYLTSSVEAVNYDI